MTAAQAAEADRALRVALDRTHRPYFAFVPIDEAAKSGAYQLLKDEYDHQHSGRWEATAFNGAGAWVYGSGAPIAPRVLEYCVRTPLDRDAA
jgi:hypothetical protein